MKQSSTSTDNGQSKKLLGWHHLPARMLICGYLRTFQNGHNVGVVDIANIVSQYCRLDWTQHMALCPQHYVTVHQKNYALVARYQCQRDNQPTYLPKTPIVIKPELNQLQHSGNHIINIFLKQCHQIQYCFQFGVLLINKYKWKQKNKHLNVESFIRGHIGKDIYRTFETLNHTIGSSRMAIILESVIFEKKRSHKNGPVEYTMKKQACKGANKYCGNHDNEADFKIDQTHGVDVAFSFNKQLDHRNGIPMKNWRFTCEIESNFQTYHCKRIDIQLNLSGYIGFALLGSVSCRKGFEFVIKLG